MDKFKKVLKCKCGSKNLKGDLIKDDDGAYNWISIRCNKCGKSVFYNGA